MARLPRSLRERDFVLLWSGQTTSLVGDGIYTIALALETLRISNHASTLSYVMAARTVPAVVVREPDRSGLFGRQAGATAATPSPPARRSGDSDSSREAEGDSSVTKRR